MPKEMVTEQSPLDVAIAVIENQGRYLIAQRIPGDSFGGYWEFPGGKVNAGETLENCLAREIEEELGILISVGTLLQVVEHRYPARLMRFHCFLCQVISGEPRALECSAWKWVLPNEFGHHQFPPASGPILQALLNKKADE